MSQPDKPINFTDIARVTHEANRAYCQVWGDDSQKPWDEAPDWQKESALEGVKAIFNGENSPRLSHDNWMAKKLEEGWKYGPEKDEKKKEHPCLVPYNKLPLYQQQKDFLFTAIVSSFIGSGIPVDRGED